MKSTDLFIRPALEAVSIEGQTYLRNFVSYSHYNYLRPGLIARAKRKRFIVALDLAKQTFGTGSAIDMGCADGVLLPSLARHFDHVAAIDINANYVEIARNLVSHLELSNVSVIRNWELHAGELKQQLGGHHYKTMFLLETLEHIGKSAATAYQDKLQFLEDAFDLLDADGAIVISVPKMVGLAFLGKYLVQTAARMPHEKLSFIELIRAGLFKDVSALEPRWSNGHIGFDDLKLQRLISERFTIIGKRNLATSRLWMIRRG